MEVGGSSDVLTQRISPSVFPLLIYTRDLGSGGGRFQSLKRTQCLNRVRLLIKLTFLRRRGNINALQVSTRHHGKQKSATSVSEL